MGRIKIGEAVTDRNGKARFQYDIRNVHEDFAIEAVYDEYSKRKSIDNVTYTILLETDMCVDTGDPIEISGYLLEDDLPMNQEQLNVFLDDVRVKTVLVNSQDGSYSATLDDVADGTHSVYVTWNNNKVSSSVETVYVGTCVYEVSLTSDKVTLDTLDPINLSGVLTRNDVPWKNQPVEIYDGSTLIDTLTTDNNGAYSKTIEGLTAGNHIFKAVNTRCESDPLNITVNKTNPDLNIEVPLVLVYSDDFLITGLLTDKHNNGVNGKTVQLKVGSTVVDSAVTAKVDGVDGIVQFTQCPVHMGTHTFQLAFDGDATYNSIDSQTVTREINKEISVITVYNPLPGSEWYDDEPIFANGTLLSDDAEPLSGKSIVVSENGATITTLHTNSEGTFLNPIPALSAGTHNLKFEFAGDEYYTASSVIRTVVVKEHDYDLTLSCSTPMIRVDDTAVVIASLTKDSFAFAGETLTYQIKHDSTVIDSGSAVTDSNGEISISYTGTGVGDVDVIVTYNNQTFLEKTYVIQEYIWNPPFTAENPCEVVRTGNGYRNIQSNGVLTLMDGYLKPGWDFDGDWQLDFDVIWNGLRYQAVELGDYAGYILLGEWEGDALTKHRISCVKDPDINYSVLCGRSIWANPSTPWIHFHIEKTDDSFTVTKSGDNCTNGTYTYTDCDFSMLIGKKITFRVRSNNGQTMGFPSFKNVIVKAL